VILMSLATKIYNLRLKTRIMGKSLQSEPHHIFSGRPGLASASDRSMRTNFIRS
jgi:hypothetical protein